MIFPTLTFTGTTLNLLKLPIVNPKGWRLARRVRRLRQTRQADMEERKERIQMFHKYGGLDKTIVRGTVAIIICTYINEK